MSDGTPWALRAPANSAPPRAVSTSWPEELVRPEDRDGYWLTAWFQERLARELEACRSLAELQAVEARIQKRYAATEEWRLANDVALGPLRIVAKARRDALRTNSLR